MLRSLYILALVSLFACSKDQPTPVAPAGKAVDSVGRILDLRLAPQSQSVIFRWSPVNGADDYDVYYMKRGGAWVPSTHDGAESFRGSFVEHEIYDWELEWHLEYRVKVRANRGDTHGEWVVSRWFIVDKLEDSTSSHEYSIFGGAEGVPSPANVRGVVLSASSVRLTWSAVDGATDYDVNYKARGGKWTISPHRGTATAHTLEGLTPGVDYRWAVKADRGKEKSVWVYGDWFTLEEDRGGNTIASGIDRSGFNIDLVFLEDHLGVDVAARHRELIRAAADRWEEIIVGDVPDTTVAGVHVLAHEVEFSAAGHIDDIRIYVVFRPVNHRSDGAANALMSHSWQRPDGLPFISVLTFKEFRYFDNFEVPGADWRTSQQSLYSVALHEIGHALGIGTVWYGDIGGSDDRPLFVGLEAARRFDRMMDVGMGVGHWRWARVPLNSDLSHWDGVAFTDIMGYGGDPVISPVTVGALADFGYEVDLSAADYIGIILAYHSYRYSGGLLPLDVRESLASTYEVAYGSPTAGKPVASVHSWCGVGVH